jgi:hypothetical protein
LCTALWVIERSMLTKFRVNLTDSDWVMLQTSLGDTDHAAIANKSFPFIVYVDVYLGDTIIRTFSVMKFHRDLNIECKL